jgi:RNA polymerase sigma-70 factor (ECF subfamily)
MEAAAPSRDFRETFDLDVDDDFADEREFIEIYRAHFGFVYATLRRLGVDEAHLDDAAQDVFVVVHRKLIDFEYRSDVRTWLYAIARRVAYRQWRTAHRVARKHEALARVPAFQPELDEIILRREGRALLLAFLDQLDEPKREAFILGELEQMGRREMGEALGVSPNTAYSRLRAAREQFEATFGSPAARASLVAQVREGEDEAHRAQHRVWAVLAPALIEDAGLPSTGLAASAVIANVKVFAITVVTGTLALVGVDIMLPRAQAETPDAPTAVTRHEDASPPRSEPRHRAAPPAPKSPDAPPRTADEPVGETSPRHRPTTTGSDSIRTENKLIESAHAHLRGGRATAAVEQLRTHAKRHPNGALAEERELLFVEALCALGDTTRASAHARSLLDAHPTSPARERIQNSCAVTNTE